MLQQGDIGLKLCSSLNFAETNEHVLDIRDTISVNANDKLGPGPAETHSRVAS